MFHKFQSIAQLIGTKPNMAAFEGEGKGKWDG